jgi:hypothetical protein
MDRKRTTALGLACFAGFLAVGLDYWRIPYAALSLPNAILGFGLVVVAVAAALARALSATRLWPTTFIVGASVPAAILVRVIHDTARDATSHNLWPLEIVLTAGPGCLAALVGAIVGGLLAPRRRG